MSKPGNLGLCWSPDLDFSVSNNTGSLGLTVLFSPLGVFFFFLQKYLVKKSLDKRSKQRGNGLSCSSSAQPASTGKESNWGVPLFPPMPLGYQGCPGDRELSTVVAAALGTQCPPVPRISSTSFALQPCWRILSTVAAHHARQRQCLCQNKRINNGNCD